MTTPQPDTTTERYYEILRDRSQRWTRANVEQAAALWLDVCPQNGVEVGTVLPKGGLRHKTMWAAYDEALRRQEGWDSLTEWVQSLSWMNRR